MRTMNDYKYALDWMVREGYFYDNRVPQRCDPNWKGRDCSTFNQFGLINAGYLNVNPCWTSFDIARYCHDTPRPDWFKAMYGSDLPGTFITKEQAMGILSVGLRGTNWGMNEDASGDGHVEEILGNGTTTVGAHSHATGIGYDPNGINNHELSYFAVLPWFLPEIALKVANDLATIAALKALAEWQKEVKATPLRFGMRNNHNVGILVQLLVKAHYLSRGVTGDNYGRVLRDAVTHFKRNHQLGAINGNYFGGPAAATLLAVL